MIFAELIYSFVCLIPGFAVFYNYAFTTRGGIVLSDVKYLSQTTGRAQSRWAELAARSSFRRARLNLTKASIESSAVTTVLVRL